MNIIFTKKTNRKKKKIDSSWVIHCRTAEFASPRSALRHKRRDHISISNHFSAPLRPPCRWRAKCKCTCTTRQTVKCLTSVPQSACLLSLSSLTQRRRMNSALSFPRLVEHALWGQHDVGTRANVHSIRRFMSCVWDRVFSVLCSRLFLFFFYQTSPARPLTFDL